MTASDIVLSTLNARYSHTSHALRCLLANLGPLRARARLLEFVLGARTETLAEKILQLEPRILGLSVYIWNVEESTRLVAMLKRLRPELVIVLGGPEVSHESDAQPIVQMADHVITGAGEQAFTQLCHQLLEGPRPLMKLIPGDATSTAQLEALVLPHGEYSDEDLRHRLTYVEASRGCPFKCEFCLSSLDKTAWAYPLPRVLESLEDLYRRGARQFKFIDRTFNLKADTSARLLQFFLDRQDPEDPCFAHFELVPDHLPDSLKMLIERFPAGALQFEIGIQSLNPAVQAGISRRQDPQRTRDNIAWLVAHTQAHLHLDLIAGLPGEDLVSFGAGFDQLVDWLGLREGREHEIQLGILKRLRGTPIIRHTQEYDLRFNPAPPYNVLSTDVLDFFSLRRLERMARYWDLLAHREDRAGDKSEGLLAALLGEAPFARMLAFSDWLYAQTDSTYRIERRRLYALARAWLETPAAAALAGT